QTGGHRKNRQSNRQNPEITGQAHQSGVLRSLHLVRMPWGIAVVETKNFRGVIVGKPHDQHWTQVITSGSRKTTKRFYNPIKQNRRRESAVRQVVADETVVIGGFVVFTGDVLIGDALRGVVCIDNTIIQSVSNYSAPMFNSGSLDSAWKRLVENNAQNAGRRDEHLAFVVKK
ncbi:nuclease-related domain-containing protein, partial [Acetobacter oeni]